MVADTCLLVYGDSLFLTGIKAQLEGCLEFELLTAGNGRVSLPAPTDRRIPRVLLFDLTATAPDFAVSLLRGHPDLLLIGVDPSSDQLVVLTYQSMTALSLADLVRVIKQTTGRTPGLQGSSPPTGHRPSTLLPSINRTSR